VCEREREGERAGGCTGLVFGPTPALTDAACFPANTASHPIAIYPTAPSVSSKYDMKFYAVVKLLKCTYGIMNEFYYFVLLNSLVENYP
jgi:hypothetical protein